jgi:hypothetical protein
MSALRSFFIAGRVISPPRPPLLAEDLPDSDDGARCADRGLPPLVLEPARDGPELQPRRGLGETEGVSRHHSVREVGTAVIHATHVQTVGTHRLEPLPDDQLGAPASDVHHDPAFRRGVIVGNAEINKTSLLLARDDLHGMAQRLGGARAERRSVPRSAQRVGSHGPDVRPVDVSDPFPETPEAVQGFLLRRFREPSLGIQPGREPDRLPEPVQNAEATGVGLGDHHVEAVRAQIQHGRGERLVGARGEEFRFHPGSGLGANLPAPGDARDRGGRALLHTGPGRGSDGRGEIRRGSDSVDELELRSCSRSLSGAVAIRRQPA